jgi:hypothetical protein
MRKRSSSPPPRKKSPSKLKINAADKAVVKMFEKRLAKDGSVEFAILDGGFKVVVKPNSVTFLDNTSTPDEWGDTFPRQDKYLGFSKTIKDVDELWIGTGSYDNVNDKSNKFSIGNTALIVKGNKCISLASYISEFRLAEHEKVTKYISTVGNNGVPSGWIKTTKGYYAISSFNCTTGFLNVEDVSPYVDLRCLDEKLKKIKGFKIIVPRT